MELLHLDAGAGRIGQRFCVYHAVTSGSPVRGALVYVHPFGEEMNKARRMAALQARRFAAAGYAVLQIDLAGCGDSSDELRDVAWEDWIEDVLLALHHLRARVSAPLWLWGARFGAPLATEAAGRFNEPLRLLLWQPVTSGAAVLAQLLRLQAAAAITNGARSPAAATTREALAGGQSLEVAGYELPGPLALRFDQARLTLPRGTPACVWLEVSTADEPRLLPGSSKVIDSWKADSSAVTARAVQGPAFWQTVEIEEAPALIDATLDAVEASG
ncbi:MAG: hydrolase 2, exosortase A system-associated [Rubrivivax sp.]